jgi:hypothetical protein
MKSVAILCRGKSLKEIDKLPVCDTLILVNSFQNELDDVNISSYVEKYDNIIHITSVGSEFYPMIEKGIYSKYNFKNIVLPYVRECLPQSTPSFIFDIKDKNGNVLDVNCLSDKNKVDMVETHRYKFTSPTCGMDSILFAINDLNAEELFIIGLDFYDGVGYFTNSHGIKEANDEQAIERLGKDEDSNAMKSFFVDFIKKHSDVNFNLFTMSKLKSDSENLNINFVGERL